MKIQARRPESEKPLFRRFFKDTRVVSAGFVLTLSGLVAVSDGSVFI